MSIIKNKKILISIALLLNSIVFIGLFSRATDVDEGIIAAHSYYLNEVGFVKSVHFHNSGFGWEDRQFHFHKLTVWIGAFTTKFFGFHLITFRFISYLFYLLFLLILYLFLKKNKTPDYYFWLFQIVFLINSTVFKFAFIYRPEIAVMAVGFLSYYLLEREKQKQSFFLILFAGIAAGLSMLIHLNGVVFIMAGTFFLFFNRKYLKGIVFGTSGSIISSLYFIDIFSSKMLIQWKEQFFADPNLTGKKAFPLLKVLDEHMRFFHSEREIIFSVLILFSLILSLKSIRGQFKGMLLYLMLLIVSMALVAHGTTTKYMMLYMPFLVLMICASINQFYSFNLVKKILYSLSFFIFLGYHIYVDCTIMASSYNVVKRNSMLAGKIPEKNSLIFADEGFVFNQIKSFAIQSPCAYDHHISKFYPNKDTTIEGLFDFLYKGKTKYILIDRLIENGKVFLQIPYDELEVGSTYFNYQVIDKGEDFILFKINEEKPQSYQADFSAETLVKTL